MVRTRRGTETRGRPTHRPRKITNVPNRVNVSHMPGYARAMGIAPTPAPTPTPSTSMPAPAQVPPRNAAQYKPSDLTHRHALPDNRPKNTTVVTHTRRKPY